MFEATHGSAQVLAGKNMAIPSSLVLSTEMMLRHLGWVEATELAVAGVSVSGATKQSQVSCDLAEMIGVDALSCSDYATADIKNR